MPEVRAALQDGGGGASLSCWSGFRVGKWHGEAPPAGPATVARSSKSGSPVGGSSHPLAGSAESDVATAWAAQALAAGGVVVGESVLAALHVVTTPHGLLGMAARPVGAGARGCQTHWVRVWVSNRTRGCTHTRTHNKPGRGRVWISTRG
jgi:hypothetical protein